VWIYHFFHKVIYVTADTNRILLFKISGICFVPLPVYGCSCFFSQQIPLEPTISARCLEKFKSRNRPFSSLCWIRCASSSLWKTRRGSGYACGLCWNCSLWNVNSSQLVSGLETVRLSECGTSFVAGGTLAYCTLYLLFLESPSIFMKQK
jgi:hypothetical protein